MRHTASGKPLPEATCNWLREQIERFGEREVAKRLGLSRDALTRVVAGLGVRPGTAALIANGSEAAAGALKLPPAEIPSQTSPRSRQRCA
jgi:hypothetical protein